MSAHTPGPWYIEEISNRDWKINSDSRDWCLLEITPAIYGESDSLSDEDKANARLIAAAPDLLEALLHMFASIPPYRHDGSPTIPDAVVEFANAAIAKATESAA